MDTLKNHYKNVNSAPEFLHRVMHFDRHPDTSSKSILNNYLRHPELYVKSSQFVMHPHPIYNNPEELGVYPKNAKHQDGGIAYLTWFVHPEELDKAVNKFDSNTYDSTKSEFNKQHPDYNPSHKELWGQQIFPMMSRTDSQEDIKSMEDKSGGEKYLASILDLTTSDLPALLEMRSSATEHMMNAHGHDESEGDTLSHYFHFPYKDETTTLHLHTRMNQATMPMEKTTNFNIDDIISHLENGNDDVYDLILERQETSLGLGGPGKIPGHQDLLDKGLMTVEKAKNPSIIESPYETNMEAIKAMFPDAFKGGGI